MYINKLFLLLDLMHKKRQITISGYPGAGKSTGGKILAKTLNYDFFSAGDFRRMAATQLGIDIDTLNFLENFKTDLERKACRCSAFPTDFSKKYLEERGLKKEYHAVFKKLLSYGDTDLLVDNQQKSLATTKEDIVVEGRLAYLHFPEAFKIFFYCEPAIAASRVFKDKRSAEKDHRTEVEVLERIVTSMESDRKRYIAKYGNIGDCYTYEENKFDMYIDTSDIPQTKVIENILKEYSWK